MTAPTAEQVAELVAILDDHACAWGVCCDTQDTEVINETRMARDCARAAFALASLSAERDALAKRVAELEQWQREAVPHIERSCYVVGKNSAVRALLAAAKVTP